MQNLGKIKYKISLWLYIWCEIQEGSGMEPRRCSNIWTKGCRQVITTVGEVHDDDDQGGNWDESRKSY